ncbi:MAG: hypothetical protein JSU05_15525, partial [Bacteroidetes bacterium]|nr:hypothetical protein [Bacteroidota bacterium]
MADYNFGNERMRDRWERRRDRWERRMDRRSRHGQVWTGLLLLLIGGAALAKSFFPLPEWLFSWQMILIVIGLFIGVRHRFCGAAWFILILIGSVFLVNDYFLYGDLHRHIWPVAIIALGLFFILRPRRQHRWDWDGGNGNDSSSGSGTNSGGSTQNSFGGGTFNSSEDFIDATNIFGGTKKNVFSKDFKGGDVVNIFGGTELNLLQSDINGTVIMEITEIFGGTKLII